MLLFGGFALFLDPVASTIAFYHSSRVYQLLLSRIEGVAVGTDLNAEVGDGASCLECVSTRACERCFHVFGVNVGLHLAAPADWIGHIRLEVLQRDR